MIEFGKNARMWIERKKMLRWVLLVGMTMAELTDGAEKPCIVYAAWVKRKISAVPWQKCKTHALTWGHSPGFSSFEGMME